MLLLGDVGGTNTRLALAEPGTWEPLAEHRYINADFPGFEAVLADYLAGNPVAITGACLAVAGPIADHGRFARLTNLPWSIDADTLATRHGLGRLLLVNDFTAAALGVTATPGECLAPLQAGEPLITAPRLVVGAGTGLGMAVLLPEGGRWRVVPGEGGHVGFSPQDEDQLRVHTALLAEYGRVTWERVVSGPGLSEIHRILAGVRQEPAAVAEAALAGEAAARRSTDVFLAAYGAFAGDMALAVLARGGVFLAGGIAAKLLPLLPGSPFLAAFNAKAEHADLAARMPVAVATDAALGLRGAAVAAMA